MNKDLKMENPRTPVIDDTESFPQSPEVLQLKYKDYKSAIEAIQQLENELNEFQASSFELEKELEKELSDLENQNDKLKDKINDLENKLNQKRIKEVEFNESKNELIKEINLLKIEKNEKNSKLIDIEILNDNFEKNERILLQNQDDLNFKMNKMFEKNVLLNSEITDLKNLYYNEKLKNDNLKIEIEEIRKENEELRNMKNNETNNKSMNRSNSLIKLNKIRTKSTNLNLKLSDLKNSIENKSNITTKLTNTNIITKTNRIQYSPNSFTLNSIIKEDN